ncbi:hypothetical protein HY629_00225 [Candidatus Uhrbacteria bacterium]|nr:hypothetical protein [Candidatus Uhrbacteria bacterium]
MDYAVAHAPKGATVVVYDDPPAKHRVVLLEKDKDKDEFVEKLTADDSIFLQLGGQADRFALACAKQSAHVFRVPLHRMAREESATGGHGDETTELAHRRRLAEALFAAAQAQRDNFYPVAEKDIDILNAAQSLRNWRLMQKARIGLHNRVAQLYRDLYLVRDRKEETIEEFFLRMATEDEKIFEDIDLEVRPEYIRSMAQYNIPEEGVAKREELLARKIAKELKKLPLYREVFEPIYGMGPLIAGRIIAGMSDVRRFLTPWKLRALAGYHHMPDGSRARRQTGKTYNVNQLLKQGVWLWTQQIVKSPLEQGSPRERLDRRKGYELVKLLRERQLSDPMFGGRTIASWQDVSLVDTYRLLGWIDGLRGDKLRKETPENEKELDGVEERYAKLRMTPYGLPLYTAALANYETAIAFSSPDTKKALKGIKGTALDKACRWLGQKLILEIFQKWSNFVGDKVPA